VDNVGSERHKAEDVLSVCSKFFDNIKFQFSGHPFFPSAFVWCWKNTTEKYVFHLEEDWELQREVNFKEFMEIFKANPKLAHLRLSFFKTTNLHVKQWQKHFFPWNGRYFSCPSDLKLRVGWCGHPSMNLGSFCRSVLPYINPLKNPEKQIKGINPHIASIINEHDFGVYCERNHPPLIKDLGREWMKANGWQKAGKNREWFTEWERKPS
jgi:hypothetical protein